MKEAFEFAFDAHQGMTRKGGKTPYISHPMAVASFVMEFGGTEDQAIAALLHDTIEDCGVTEKQLRERFGETVAQIVAGCSDSETTPKPPWKERKTRYLDHLASARSETLLVSACDKLHNARAIVRDVRAEGEVVWNRFSALPPEIAWYYRSLVQIFQGRMTQGLELKLVRELAQVVDELQELAGVRR